jgi:hypothetical protein
MGDFADKVCSLTKTSAEDWERNLAEQEARFRSKAPLSADIAMDEAARRLQHYQELAFRMGYTMRKNRPQSDIEKEVSGNFSPDELSKLEGSPGREIVFRVPEKAASWFEPRLLSKQAGPITDPIRYGLQDVAADAMRFLSEKKEEATKITPDPSTHPAYYPAMAIGVPKSFLKGYATANKEVQDKTKGQVDSELEHARKEFESALSGEYDKNKREGSTEAKAAALIDGFAQIHVKKAEGELNQVTNMYLGLATLLGSGAFAVGHNWAEKHDKKLQELKAMREYLRRRAYIHPPVVIAEPEDRAPLDVKPEPAPVEDAATAAAI